MPTVPCTLPRLVGILLLLAAVYVGLQLYPSELPAPATGRRADLLATVFYDQAMVFLLRLVILCAAAFTVFSIVARIWNREWLTKAGPFEVERAVPLVEDERDDLKSQLGELRADYVRLAEAILTSPASPAHGGPSPGRRPRNAAD
jgi:hypothetical protein